MFSKSFGSKVSDSERLEQIKLELGKLEPYKYEQRVVLRNEKAAILQRLKGKQPTEQRCSPQRTVATMPGYYTPAEFFREHPDSHKDRQNFRRDKKSFLRLQIKDKQ